MRYSEIVALSLILPRGTHAQIIHNDLSFLRQSQPWYTYFLLTFYLFNDVKLRVTYDTHTHNSSLFTVGAYN